MNYDIIGDVHGHADALQGLLRKLGYRERMGTWCHGDRIAAFVGDFVDPGPKQLETVNIVRRMVDAGNAVAVMGNHELNAIAWATPDPSTPGDFLRSHHSKRYGYSNRKQHAAFLGEVERKPDLHATVIEWFLSLPLWLELPEINLVHACWYKPAIEHLRPILLPGNRLDRDLLVDAVREPEDESEKDTPEPTIFKAVEWLTKGIEVPMPPGQSFTDNRGDVRKRVRVQWWTPGPLSYHDAAFIEDSVRERLPLDAIPAHAVPGYAEAKPVFFGHYWLQGKDRLFSPRAACVDYSIARRGRLCAYQFDGEPELDVSKFRSVREDGA